MGHGNYLTKEENTQFTLNQEIYRYLEKYRQSLEIANNNLNMLDWGYGMWPCCNMVA